MTENQNSSDDQPEQSPTGDDETQANQHSHNEQSDRQGNDGSHQNSQSQSRADKGNTKGGSERRGGGLSGHSESHDQHRHKEPDEDENEFATDFGIGLAEGEPVPREVDDPAHELAGPSAHDHVLTEGRTRPYIVGAIFVAAIVLLAVIAIGIFKALSEGNAVKFCAGDQLANELTEGAADDSCKAPPTPG